MFSCFPLRRTRNTAQRVLAALKKIMSLYFSIFGEGVGFMSSKRFLVCDRMKGKMIELPDYRGDRNYDDAFIDLQKRYLGCTDCEFKCPPTVRYAYRKKEG